MKERLLFLGDIHGNFNLINQYIKLYKITNAHIIQVGDFGVGFHFLVKEQRALDLIHPLLVKNNVHVWVVRGNHDYPGYFKIDPFGFTNIHLVPDYTVLNLAGYNVLFLGGAVSVDRGYRYTKNQKNGDFLTINGNEQWWPDEGFVLDVAKLGEFRNIDIVATHNAPHYCPIDNTFGVGPFVEEIIKQTKDVELKTDINVERNAITQAFTILKLNNDIKLHVYGHFHKADLLNIYGTEHRLLNIGELWEKRD